MSKRADKYVAIEIFCRQHPSRRLAWFGRCTTTPVRDQGFYKIFIGDVEFSLNADGLMSNVHFKCRACRTDEAWRVERMTKALDQMYAPGAKRTVRVEV